MIVSTSTSVMNLVKLKRQLEKSQEEINDIRDTIKGLGQVQTQTDELLKLYILVYEDISDGTQSKIKLGVKDSIDQLNNSLREFSSVRRQTNTLNGIVRNLTRYKADTETSWKLAVEAMLQPYFELFNLVQQLPEFTTQNSELLLLKIKLAQYKTNIPKNTLEMRDFRQKFEKFKKLLSSVEGLTPKIQNFLAKVVNGTAVLADMDQEILDWCSQSGRNRVFLVKFTG